MALRYNSPPNWPSPPEGWTPPPGWKPDPSWEPAPQGWDFWVDDSLDGFVGTSTSPSASTGAAEPAPPSFAGKRATNSWFVRHKVLTGIGAASILLIVLVAALSGNGDGASERSVAGSTATQDGQDDEKSAEEIAAEETAEAERLAEEEAAAAAQAETKRLAEEQRIADEAAAAAAAAAETARLGSVAQQNAYRSAVNYLDLTAFSRSGLAGQLEFEGFSTPDAEFAIARLEAEGGVDWNAQAAASAANYLELTSFSRSGLIDQLTFEGYTAEQAEHGVSTTGL
ncbi:Ltp family lipoprotein [Oerskovia paurometabola]|uniref:Ltp family lipoprotein n=1 Tax=Oerskovia paurometabola TaxID=162170 RepID=A0ABW1X984_9CELL|nr:Ltp family lipoprotein [Oerskovia paurometabola]MBM7497680.1 hypothetical protein [Oerskovia paurometabola]